MTEPTQQQRLEAEFDRTILQTTPKGGRKLTYVPVHEVIARLNNVLGTTGWEWKVERIWRDQLDPDWVLAYGELTATVDGVTSTKSGSGGVQVKRNKPDHKTTPNAIVDLGDEFKGAESDALKKAAQRFGIGLHLSRDPEAIAYEMNQLVEEQAARAPQDAGWRSAEHRNQVLDNLKDRIRQQGDEVRKAMNTAWPLIVTSAGGQVTAAEYEQLEAKFQELVTPQPQYDAVVPGQPDPWPEPQETAPAPASAPIPPSQVQPPPPRPPRQEETTQAEPDVAAQVAEAFPGTTDVTPASRDQVQAIITHIDRFKREDDRAFSSAWGKWKKEHKLTDNWNEWTEADANRALDFIEEL